MVGEEIMFPPPDITFLVFSLMSYFESSIEKSFVTAAWDILPLEKHFKMNKKTLEGGHVRKRMPNVSRLLIVQ